WIVQLKDVKIMLDGILFKNPNEHDEHLKCKGVLSEGLEIARKKHVAKNVAPYRITIEGDRHMNLSNKDDVVNFLLSLEEPLKGHFPAHQVTEYLNWSRIKFLDKQVKFTDDSGAWIVVEEIRSNAGYNSSMELLEELSYKVEYVDAHPNN